MAQAKTAFLYRVLSVLVVVGLLLGSVSPANAIFQTIGDFLSLGANTVRELQEAIGLAGGEIRATLQELDGLLRDLLSELEDTYQNNLNITLDSVDALTRNKILEVENLMLTVNELLQEDIRLISDEAKEVIQEATLRIRVLSDEIKQDLQDVVIVAGETGVFLIERTAENIVIIASVIILAIGIIIFVGILLRGGVKATGFAAILGYGLVLAFIVLFGALILVPQVRNFVMTSTGIGLRQRLETTITQPSIFAVIPDTVKVGETQEVEIWGSQLLPNGEEPTITIAGASVPVTAFSPERIVIDVSDVAAAQAQAVETFESFGVGGNLFIGRDLARDLELIEQPAADRTFDDRLRNPIDIIDLIDLDPGDIITQPDGSGGGLELPAGSSTMKLDYANFEDILTVLRIIPPVPPVQPADLRITNFNITPAGLVRNQNATASITIRNDGETAATNFQLRWKPTATHPGHTISVPNLAPGSGQTFTFNQAYSTIGTFDSVATVDVLNSVEESNEGNNSSQRSVAVAEQPPRQARVTVTFTGVTIHDDADPWPKGAGEIFFTFDVNGRTGRFPSSGSTDISDNSTRSFTSTFVLTLAEGETLSIFVNGEEGDDDSGDDAMGIVSTSYTTGQSWGAGTHNDRSNCPDGCYTIHYTISREFIN